MPVLGSISLFLAAFSSYLVTGPVNDHCQLAGICRALTTKTLLLIDFYGGVSDPIVV